MTCARCCGLMVRQAEVRLRWIFWRCTACGERLDAVISCNRRSQAQFMRPILAKETAELLFQQLISAG